MSKVVRGATGPGASENKASEATFTNDRLFDMSHDMLCVAGFDGYFKRLNPAWQRTLGFTSAELMSKPFVEFVHPDDRAATDAESARQMAEGATTLHFENRYACRDGTYRWLSWTAVPEPDEKLVYAVARDVCGTPGHSPLEKGLTPSYSPGSAPSYSPG
ncbi:MAG: PAS domain-containing protein [Candidatus Dormibacteria bacterium]